MKLFLTAVAALALTACSANTPNVCESQPDPQTLRSVVQINNADGETSSGVVIAKNTVLTVAHAVRSAAFVIIGGESRSSTIIKVDDKLDLALLTVATETLPALPISAAPGAVDQTLWAVGYPLGREKRTSMGLLKYQTSEHLYASVHINKGTSGGGLMSCETGRFVLAGIIRGYLAHDDGINLINTGDSVAVHSSSLRRFLNPPDIANASLKIAQNP